MAGTMTFLLLAATALAANLIRGLTGLGSAVVFVPVASLVWTAAMALAVSAVLDLVGNAWLCWLNRETVHIPRSWWRVLAALAAGILVGSLFVTLDDRIVRRLTGVVILVTVAAIGLLSRVTLPTLPKKFETGVGFLVGLISPVSGVPGPAVALMLAMQGKQTEIARLTPPFLLVNAIVRIIGLAALNKFSPVTLNAAAFMIPFGLIGVYGGQRLGRGMPFHQLKYVIIGIVAVSGVWMVAR